MRVKTSCFQDIVISRDRMVWMGMNKIVVRNISGGLEESIEDEDLQFEIDISDKLTSIALSKDGRYLLANISLT